jgi:Holliday junction resolvase RusA-like endonuclease
MMATMTSQQNRFFCDAPTADNGELPTPAMGTISFIVHGEPATAGSKRGYPIRRRDGSLGVAMAPDNPTVHNWKGMVADAARQAYSGPLLIGAVKLEITFIRPRPASHYGTGRNAHRLKASAPRWPITKPDLTKLRRAVEDALKGVVWRDDSQVVEGIDRKRYGESFITTVEITPLEPDREERF